MQIEPTDPNQTTIVSTIAASVYALIHSPTIQTAAAVLCVTTLHAATLVVRRRFDLRKRENVRTMRTYSRTKTNQPNQPNQT